MINKKNHIDSEAGLYTIPCRGCNKIIEVRFQDRSIDVSMNTFEILKLMKKKHASFKHSLKTSFNLKASKMFVNIQNTKRLLNLALFLIIILSKNDLLFSNSSPYFVNSK